MELWHAWTADMSESQKLSDKSALQICSYAYFKICKHIISKGFVPKNENLQSGSDKTDVSVKSDSGHRWKIIDCQYCQELHK